VFDKHGCGRLPVETIKHIIRSIQRPFTDGQINELIGQVEKDPQETVDYAEFVKSMLDF
jgi:Ca2+-binding EF-hand superfamily protein